MKSVADSHTLCISLIELTTTATIATTTTRNTGGYVYGRRIRTYNRILGESSAKKQLMFLHSRPHFTSIHNVALSARILTHIQSLSNPRSTKAKKSTKKDEEDDDLAKRVKALMRGKRKKSIPMVTIPLPAVALPFTDFCPCTAAATDQQPTDHQPLCVARVHLRTDVRSSSDVDNPGFSRQIPFRG